MRFEPELEAQKNTVPLELHSIPVSSSVEETKNKLVELKVRIARAEDILGEKITDMQKKTALLQILDPITKQHTANVQGSSKFDQFYTVVMNFTNNASSGYGHTSKANVNVIFETENYYSEGEEHYDHPGGQRGRLPQLWRGGPLGERVP